MVTAASLRAAVAGALAAAALGCGGGGGARPLPTVTAKPLAPSKAPTAIVLYRNGAWVTVRRAIDAPAGRSVVELPLAERLDATEVTLTRVTGATVVSTTVTAPRDRWRDFQAAWSAAQGSFDADRIELTDPREQAPPPLAEEDRPRLKVVLDGDGGPASLEMMYWTDAIRWQAGYTVFADGAHGEFDGAIVVTQPADVDLGEVALRIVDADADGAGRASGDDDDGEEDGYYDDDGDWVPRARPRRKPSGAEPPAPMAIADGITLAGSETRVHLPGAHEQVEVKELLVVDAIGTRLDLSARVPRKVKEYGANESNTPPVEQSYEFVLPAILRREDIPAGDLRLFARRGDQVRPLGQTRVGGDAIAADAVATKATIAVGSSAKVSATRKQTDFAIDADAKRLIEEITIELDNKGPTDAVVLVREHLYRGLNWSLAYYSVPALEKEGPQQISMRVTAPAKRKTKVSYRVVYTW